MLCWPHFDMTCASPTGWSVACRLLEDADPVIAPVGDIDVAVGIHRHIGWVIEEPGLRILSTAARLEMYGPR